MKSGLIAYFRATYAHTRPEPDFEPPIRPEHPQPSPDRVTREPAPQRPPSRLPEELPTPGVYPTAGLK